MLNSQVKCWWACFLLLFLRIINSSEKVLSLLTLLESTIFQDLARLAQNDLSDSCLVLVSLINLDRQWFEHKLTIAIGHVTADDLLPLLSIVKAWVELIEKIFIFNSICCLILQFVLKLIVEFSLHERIWILVSLSELIAWQRKVKSWIGRVRGE